jgi:hypothetical protein
MYAFEYVVDRGATTSVVSPCFDNTLVVTIEHKTLFRTCNPGDSIYEAFETQGFGLANVTGAIEGLPARNELPGMPATTNDDRQANAGAGVGECLEVNVTDGQRDGPAKKGLGETGSPPDEVLANLGWGMSTHERTITEYAQHGLKTGKVGTTSRDDKRGV